MRRGGKQLTAASMPLKFCIFMYMKILLLDASLCGVTTLGRALSRKLKLPFIETRDYEWDRATTYSPGDKRAPDERDALLRKDLGKYDSWILGGNIIKWEDGLFPYFDLIVYLWLPFDVGLEQMKKSRGPLEAGIFSLFDSGLKERRLALVNELSEISRRRGSALKMAEAHDKWLSKYTCPIIEFREDETTEGSRLESVLTYIKTSREG